MRLAAAIVVTMWAIAGVALAGEPPLVSAVKVCPAKAACIVVDINIPEKDSDPSRVVRAWNADCKAKVFRVRGRLRGSGVRTYHLALQGGCEMDCADGRAAYFGRSPRNAPIILTNRGRLEIVDVGVEVGIADDLIVIDEARQTIAKYIGYQAGSGGFFVERDRVYVRHNSPCITAPQARPGLLALADARHCPALTAGDNQFVAFKDMLPATQAFVRKLLEANKVAEGIEDAKFPSRAGVILVQFNDNCYQ